jgi:hypothetical protein
VSAKKLVALELLGETEALGRNLHQCQSPRDQIGYPGMGRCSAMLVSNHLSYATGSEENEEEYRAKKVARLY